MLGDELHERSGVSIGGHNQGPEDPGICSDSLAQEFKKSNTSVQVPVLRPVPHRRTAIN